MNEDSVFIYSEVSDKMQNIFFWRLLSPFPLFPKPVRELDPPVSVILQETLQKLLFMTGKPLSGPGLASRPEHITHTCTHTDEETGNLKAHHNGKAPSEDSEP